MTKAEMLHVMLMVSVCWVHEYQDMTDDERKEMFESWYEEFKTEKFIVLITVLRYKMYSSYTIPTTYDIRSFITLIRNPDMLSQLERENFILN